MRPYRYGASREPADRGEAVRRAEQVTCAISRKKYESPAEKNGSLPVA